MGRFARAFGFLSLAVSLAGCRFYEVDEGKFYRSPQPTAEDIDRAAELGVKTVINLRGASPGKLWYDEEKAATTRHNMLQIDIGMSAGRLPHREDLINLLDAFANAPRPILIHCLAGVDRTGEASAIYEMLYMGKSKEEALEMLSAKFAHFERNMPAKIYFIRDLWQGERWAREEYDPCSGQYRHYNPNNGACRGEKPVPPVGEDEDT